MGSDTAWKFIALIADMLSRQTNPSAEDEIKTADEIRRTLYKIESEARDRLR